MASSNDEFNLMELIKEAQNRWLRPAEVLFLLKNYQSFKLSADPPTRPQSGALFLFDRKVLRFFRKDGYNWRKKKDGKTVREAHERLKVGNTDALHCYYAHGEENPNFQRRSYWMLDEAYDHIVLVHYREVTEISQTRFNSTLLPNVTTEMSNAYLSQKAFSSQVQNRSDTNDFGHPCQSDWIYSPGSLEEVSSNHLTDNDEADSVDVTNRNGKSRFFVTHEHASLTHHEISCLQELTKELDIDDSTYSDLQSSEDTFLYDASTSSRPHGDWQMKDRQAGTNFDPRLGKWSLHKGSIASQPQDADSPSWKEVLEYCLTSSKSDVAPIPSSRQNIVTRSGASSVNKLSNTCSIDLSHQTDANVSCISSEKFTEKTRKNDCMVSSSVPLPRFNEGNLQASETVHSQDFEYGQVNAKEEAISDGTESNSIHIIPSPPKRFVEQTQHVIDLDVALSSENSVELKKSDSFAWLENEEISAGNTSLQANYFGTVFDQSKQVASQELAMDSGVTISEVQQFSIHVFVPNWAYASEGSKIIIIGDFIGNPSGKTWHCMVGDIQVPAEVIRDGILCCKAPPHAPGKLPFCVTHGNREACSEIREFEYRVEPPSSFVDSSQAPNDARFERDELMLQVRLAHFLFSGANSSLQLDTHSKESIGSPSYLEPAVSDQWEQLEHAVRDDTISLQQIKERLLEAFIKDKFLQWLSFGTNAGEKGAFVLDKYGQGVLHLAAALGYDWAINPVLNAGVGINFRDVHGWTALHWAAHFGREKTVAALIAADASSSAVTDPTTKYPCGRTAADIAAACGHGGLAGYLAEASLTSRLRLLTLAENEISKVSAAVEADRAVESVSSRTSIQQTPGATEDQLSMKDSLAAVRNAAQAAARIQAAFRAHSFRKREQKAENNRDEYGMTQADVQGLSAASRAQKVLRNHREHNLNKAAICIQRKFRGWKGRKDFLNLKRNVVKIQAHVRGHQARMKYKTIIWTVGILDKAILRWRRKGNGLRGFKAELREAVESENEDDDEFLRTFRKEKVNPALNEAVGRVMHMIDSPKARQQYRRMLDRYQQIKSQYQSAGGESSSCPIEDLYDEYMNLVE